MRSSDSIPKVRVERIETKLCQTSTYDEPQMPQYLDRLGDIGEVEHQDEDDHVDSDPGNEGFSDGFEEPQSGVEYSSGSDSDDSLPPSRPPRRSNMTKKKSDKNPSKQRPNFSIIGDNNEKRFKCNQCSTEWPDSKSFYSHHYLTHCKSPVECQICSKVLKCRSRLREHMLRTHRPIVKSGRKKHVFVNKRKPVSLPKRYTFNQETGKYKCNGPNCDVELHRLSSLHEHYTVIHLGASFSCQFCDKLHLTKERLETHESKCVCKHTPENAGVTNVHPQASASAPENGNGLMAIVPDNEGLISLPGLRCHICNKTFSTYEARKMHHQCVHLKQRDHICDICGKSFLITCTLH